MDATRTIEIEGFGGTVQRPGSSGYDQARAIWNLMHDRRPAAIVGCRSAADVAAAIRFARGQSLTLAVRGGGHSLPGFSTVDDGLVIDLRPLNHVVVDPETRTVRAGGGALLGDVDRAAQAYGLVVPAGVVSHTGVGGLTLGGGVGRLMRRFGLTIDSLLGAEIVLADGRIVHVGAEQHADLFWAIRGGGGNFGVVTEFEFRAHELTELSVLACFHPLDAAADVLRMADVTIASPDTPRELLWTSFLRRGPAGAPFMTPEFEGHPGLMSLIEWSGEPEQGRRLLARIRDELAPPISEISEVPYLGMQTLTDDLLAPGTLRAYLKAGYADELTDDMIEVLRERGSRVRSPLSVIEVLSVGGAIRDVAPEATAFPHRGSRWLVNIAGQWREPDATECERAWVRDTFAALEQHLTGGVYSNFMGEDEGDRSPAAYGATLARLQRVKAAYDPDNVFRLNQNIQPAGSNIQPAGSNIQPAGSNIQPAGPE